MPALGRLIPPDDRHLQLYGLRAGAVGDTAPSHVEREIRLPRDIKDLYDQGNFNACTGASASQLACIFNTTRRDRPRKYNFMWLWDRAKATDDFGDTNPGDNNGSTVRAALDILRKEGHVRGLSTRTKTPKPNEDDGIMSFYWLSTVDDIRGAIAKGIPVVMGTAWTDAMSDPTEQDGRYRMPESIRIDRNAMGHAYIVTAASDDREAFGIPNTWGSRWPHPGVELADVPYRLMEQLLADYGEAAVCVDRAQAKALGLVQSAMMPTDG